MQWQHLIYNEDFETRLLSSSNNDWHCAQCWNSSQVFGKNFFATVLYFSTVANQLVEICFNTWKAINKKWLFWCILYIKIVKISTNLRIFDSEHFLGQNFSWKSNLNLPYVDSNQVPWIGESNALSQSHTDCSINCLKYWII